MGGYVAGYVLRILSSLILTRLLAPEMFGVMAVASVVQVTALMLSDVGLRPSVVQSRRGDDPAFLDTAWTLQIIRGLAVWTICIVVALMIWWSNRAGWVGAGSVYAVAELPAIIVATGFTAVIFGFESTNCMTCDRNLDLRRISVMEIVSQVASLAVAVALAWATRSVWSFVLSAFVSAAIMVAMSHLYLPGRRNHFRLESEALGELARFGRWILLSSAFSVLASNGDRILLAGWITPTELGLYALAFNLVGMVSGAGMRLFWTVGSPAMSQVSRERPEALADIYYKFRLPFDAIFILCAGGLYSGGDAIVALIYDARYANAGTALSILSFGLLVARFELASCVYVALNQPRNLGLVNSLRVIALFTAVPLANWAFGFEGALWAIALHGLVTLPVIYVFNARHGLNRPVFELAVLLFWPVGYLCGLAGTALIAQFQVLS